MRQQCTLKRPVSCCGVGIHSGAPVNLTIHPAPYDHGVVFCRTDVAQPVAIPADYRYVVETRNSTTLGVNGTRVGTVEHLMAALYGLGVDNALVELDGPEVPIMDGSAAPFVALIGQTGLQRQGKSRRRLRILETIEVSDGDAVASVAPAETLSVEFTIDYPDTFIGRQIGYWRQGNGSFAEELCEARTYGWLKDVAMLLQSGLAQGGSLDNAVVLTEDGVLNEGGLRFHDEPVRHKLLDSVGDLALLPYPVIGHFQAYKSGHRLNQRLVREIMRRKDAWRLEDAEPERQPMMIEVGAPAYMPRRATAPLTGD